MWLLHTAALVSTRPHSAFTTPFIALCATQLWTAILNFPHAWTETLDALSFVAGPTPPPVTIVTHAAASRQGPLLVREQTFQLQLSASATLPRHTFDAPAAFVVIFLPLFG